MDKIVIFIIPVLLLSFCNRKKSWELRVDKTISQLTHDIEISEVNLDEIDKLHVKPDKILGPDTTQELAIIVPSDIIILNDSLYVLDQSQSSIIVLNEEGKLVRKIDREGRGPGEVTRPFSMTTNGKFVFVYDFGNTRLQKYDLNFNVLNSITTSPDPYSKSVSVADSLLYFFNGLKVNAGEPNLINQYSLYPNLKERRSLLPRLLPPGQQPAVINNVTFCTNSKGYLVVGYTNLPWLFLYNSKGQMVHSIRFSGSPIEKVNGFNEKNKREYETNPRSTLGLAPYIYSILVDDKLNIYMLTVDKNLIVLSRKDNKYKLKGIYILNHPNGTGIDENMTISNNQLFLQYQNFPNDVLVYHLANFL